jgi:hypothetical protein
MRQLPRLSAFERYSATILGACFGKNVNLKTSLIGAD